MTDDSKRPFKTKPPKTNFLDVKLTKKNKNKNKDNNWDEKNKSEVNKKDEDDEEQMIEKIKTMMKTKKNKGLGNNHKNGHNEITAEEINSFHEKNEKDFKEQQEETEDDDDEEMSTTKKPTTTTEKPITKKPVKEQVVQTSGFIEDGIKRKGVLKKRFPQAIIAGVKKSGTRALLSFLSRHPLVKSGGKEMHFFDKNDTYTKGLDWYLDQMPESYENELTIEKTPGYFVKPYVPKRIMEFSKSVKLIFIFREPVERAISDYAQALANEKQIKFERTVFTKTKPRKVNENTSKVNIGLYSKHLVNWLHYFPRMQMLFVNGNEFIKNPVPGLIKVQKFLDLPVLLNEKHFIYNKTKGFYCTLNNKEGHEVKCLGDSKGRTHPKVRDSALRKLKEFYKPWNERFFELIGEDYGWPTTKTVDKDE